MLDVGKVPCDEYEIIFPAGPGYQSSHKVLKDKDGKWIKPLIAGSQESLLEAIRNAIDKIENPEQTLEQDPEQNPEQ